LSIAATGAFFGVVVVVVDDDVVLPFVDFGVFFFFSLRSPNAALSTASSAAAHATAISVSLPPVGEAKERNSKQYFSPYRIETKPNLSQHSAAYHELLIVSIRVTRAVNRGNSIAKLALDVVVSDVVDVEFAKRTAYRSTLESTTKTIPIENTTRRFPT
jgi:hypothetical protein